MGSLSGKLKVFGLDDMSEQARARIVKKMSGVRFPKLDVDFVWLQETFGDNWIWSSPIQTDYTEIYFINSEDELFTRLKFPTAT